MITVILEVKGEEYLKRIFHDSRNLNAMRFAKELSGRYRKFLRGKEYAIYIQRPSGIKNKTNEMNKIPCVKMDLNGIDLKEYDSVVEASRDVNCHPSAILRAFGKSVNGKPYTCCGYRWKRA